MVTFKRTTQAIMLVGVSVCLTLPLLANSTKSVKKNSQISTEPKKVRAGGGAGCVTCNSASGKISTVRDANNIATNRLPRRTVVTHRHVLAAPERFPKDGVYIWCDSDAVWTMFWKGRRKYSVTAVLTASKPLRIKKAVTAKIKRLETDSNSLIISNEPNSHAGIVQFDSADDSIYIDVLIDGRRDPNKLFVGSLLNNPKRFPLKLATRRTFSQEGALETKITTSQQSKELISSVYPSKIPALAAQPSGNKGGGGSQSGAKVK